MRTEKYGEVIVMLAVLRAIERSLAHGLSDSLLDMSRFWCEPRRARTLERAKQLVLETSSDRQPSVAFGPAFLRRMCASLCGSPVLNRRETLELQGVVERGISALHAADESQRQDLVDLRLELTEVVHRLYGLMPNTTCRERAWRVRHYNTPSHVQKYELSDVLNELERCSVPLD